MRIFGELAMTFLVSLAIGLGAALVILHFTRWAPRAEFRELHEGVEVTRVDEDGDPLCFKRVGEPEACWSGGGR